ncbi:glutamine-hydrolyzing carbamoyl-phosphate synthase small subunit [Helicobacter mustelae]|uniref:Carbamoyl phosphate synthase small chain n=1 Tax=Helicobacter mustelae (strain ATCC 43772 / CCUG 25715 / CIP 103759 / LMG 18044 / NCTC 12198 / R85-136P) TaxID=679897 RepID=D3UIU5_HELM1|nr:glutamine-hydrolyzing carbamoyl-phosphate synthase small subunit [Helicobacter mustelae]CBG40420.1 carbamoyl-phosphate synthase small chain [Helicobacter mustelae 12198]SQH71920.1 carbamoyl-phosphate synthase small subunit [Helicobacter mustelae]
MQEAWVYLENGMFFEASSFGAQGSSVGEIVFNTSMSGYQEIITDPSYAGQFVVFSMPEIGIVGANPQDAESKTPHCKGILVREYNEYFSNFRAKESLDLLLRRSNIMGIARVNTRDLIKTVRQEGSMMMIASTEISDKQELRQMLKKSQRIEEINYINLVSTKSSYKHQRGVFDFETWDYEPSKTKKNIIAIDFGIKTNILNELTAAGLEVEILPHSFLAEDIIARFASGQIQGVFLSNGPGDPMILRKEIQEIQKLIVAKIPMFGICLGHQLLSIAHGYETYKLKFGHHGGNHPVKNMQTGEVEITSQNHNYSVPESIKEVAEITHRNLFDGTIEGIAYRDAPIFSVQYHPESSPGPKEARKLFLKFANMMS